MSKLRGAPESIPAALDRIAILFSAGWRLFFFAAGLYAVITGLLWASWLLTITAASEASWLQAHIPPSLWHGHEMIYGYAVAALAGFSLTAVPEWTKTPPLKGRTLVLLGSIYLSGRIVMWAAAVLPRWLVAVIDLAFLPLLAGFIAIALSKRPAPRNLVLLAIFAVLLLGNILFHSELSGWAEEGASLGLIIGLLGFAGLIAMIGGRVVPAFTRNALQKDPKGKRLPQSFRALEVTAILGLWLLLAARIGEAPDWVLASLAAVATIAHGLRLGFWDGERTLKSPILWSLHLGYLWLVIGLGLLALSYATPWLGETEALHAIAIGGIGGMTLAIMTRAALGHGGRPLTVSRPIALSYLLIAFSALLRVVGPAVAPQFFMTWALLGALAWVLAFGIFLVVYWPIFTTGKISSP